MRMGRFDHVVLYVAPDAVLRAEQCRQLHTLYGLEDIRRMPKLMIDRCLITDQSHPSTFN
jgi:hypothetical protein